MIDVKATTLVPSYRALVNFKRSGALDALMEEYAGERAVIVQHVDCDARYVTVTLSPAAAAVSVKDLDRAAGDPGLRRRLTRIHAIHPSPTPTATYRYLHADHVGHSRHGDDEWLWAASPTAVALVEEVLARRHLHWRSPSNNLWPVDEATIIPLGIKVAPLLEDLAAVATVVDVDRNGRPYPTS